MKITIIFLLLCIGFSCDEPKTESGYSCVNGTCTATFDNPTYLTLQDCQTICNSGSSTPKVTSPGSVTLTFNWDIHRKCALNDWYPCWDVSAGIGLSQSDVDKEAYFNSKLLSAPGIYSITNLAPGKYYYRAKKTIRLNCVQSGTQFCDMVDATIKSGSFQVSSNKTTSITVTF